MDEIYQIYERLLKESDSNLEKLKMQLNELQSNWNTLSTERDEELISIANLWGIFRARIEALETKVENSQKRIEELEDLQKSVNRLMMQLDSLLSVLGINH